MLSLHLDKKDFSLHHHSPANTSISLPPITGHTSHLHVPSNSLLYVFGKSQNKDVASSPVIIPSTLLTSAFQQEVTPPSSYSSKNRNNKPASRYQHTSVLINNDDLYVIGGRFIDGSDQQLIAPQDTVWKYSFVKHTWSQQSPITKKSALLLSPSMAGHTTVQYNNRWLISCFGQQADLLVSNSCTWFDIITLNSTITTTNNNNSSKKKEWPVARRYASMIQLPNCNNEYILFGGETEKEEIFDDLWKLHVDSVFSMTWKKINYKNTNNIDYKRSGHASALIDDTNVVLYYGGQNGNRSLATDPIYFDLSKMEWIDTRILSNNGGGLAVRENYGNEEIDDNGSGDGGDNSLSGGSIVGIVVGVIAIIALGVGLFIWKKRQQRQQQVHQMSRAARFTAPMHSIALKQQRDEEKLQQQENSNKNQGGDNRMNPAHLSLPDLALSRHSSNNRISAISLGEEFRFSADDYGRQSHQSLNNSGIPKIEVVQSYKEGSDISANNIRRESTGFKRLTLNLFSGSSLPQQQDEYGSNSSGRKKDRSSSLFQLRASRLLQPGTPSTPNTPDGKFSLFSTKQQSALHSRASLGAKSVASVQWVGFNDNMDYKGSNWRDSSASAMHLAVINAHGSSPHTSLYYTSDSAQSTPRSPRFPSHLRDSVAHYQLSTNEANSWNVEVVKDS